MKLEIDKSLLETSGQLLINDDGGYMVNFPGYDEDEEMVKAKKMVAIVNAHDDLVEALRDIANYPTDAPEYIAKDVLKKHGLS